MVNKDYRRELDLVSPQKNVPRSVAIAVLIGAAAALSFGVVEIVKAARHHNAPKAAPTAAASTQ